MKVSIANYSPDWAQCFDREASLLRGLLPADTLIEHIGSTAVPDLAAKPIIDIMVGLASFAGANAQIPKIHSLGYEYVSEFESSMPLRRFFRKVSGGCVISHIHMVEIHSVFWQEHLLFRDYLRSHADAARAYAELKLRLAAVDWPSADDYAKAKTEFIEGMKAEAKKPNKAPEPRRDLSRFLQSQESRQVASWLIFDVGLQTTDLDHRTLPSRLRPWTTAKSSRLNLGSGAVSHVFEACGSLLPMCSNTSLAG